MLPGTKVRYQKYKNYDDFYDTLFQPNCIFFMVSLLNMVYSIHNLRYRQMLFVITDVYLAMTIPYHQLELIPTIDDYILALPYQSQEKKVI